jgi:hypothetical protein
MTRCKIYIYNRYYRRYHEDDTPQVRIARMLTADGTLQYYKEMLAEMENKCLVFIFIGSDL